uniref:Desmoplakin b n=1 Tax=Pygocentrus nattereri TaxID=42514 RepID=A0AAR2K079_PYGNA
QLISHNKFHSSIQRSMEVERAREELKLSFSRSAQLRELQNIIEEISREIMWVNDREEEELVFDWGNKNIDVYIPKKQESYSKLMSELEEKEKDLNKLKLKVDNLLVKKHPASDKIEAYMETLQTQWSWLLQITKCIHVHLKENAAYSQFFTEANETYSKLQQEHETIRRKFTCDKTTPLQNLQELLKGLEKERERLMEQKQQVQHLVNKSKSIVRLRPRNPEDKSSSPVIVQALCDFRQDQKVICKGDEGILQDNSERTKWHVTGPGGLDMQVPSICLFVPPPNPLSISLANKNEQYYEAILSLWNQLYINIKSLISWQYCLQDINRINSLTISMLAQMRPEEYRNIIKSLETRYQEFQRNSMGSEIFGEEDRRTIETQYTGAQQHYDQLVVQLPAYSECIHKHIHILHKQIKFLSLKEQVLKELEDMKDTDKAQFLRSQLNLINQRLDRLDSHTGTYLLRLKALKSLLQALLQAEDVVKVYEARLTERDTTSLDPAEVQEYQSTLRIMQAELEQKKHVLGLLEAELSKTRQYNEQIYESCQRCDIEVCQYAEHVSLLSDRWKRIQTQINKLASYSAGLETLLNIPIKRTMLQSPSTVVYHFLIFDYCRHLGDSLKNLEQLKIRNTRIDLLEEELRLLKAGIHDRDAKNVSLQEALSQYQLQLSESQEHLLSLEEVKRSQAMQCSAAQESLSSSQSHLQELMEELQHYKLLLEKEKANKKILEERYTSQQEEHEEAMRKRQRELEGANWAKIELEKTVADQTREVERLKRQLDEEAQNVKEAQMELAKTSSLIQASQSQCTELQQERDALIRKMNTMEQDLTRMKKFEEELNRVKLSLESELRLKTQLQEENGRLRKEFSHWKKMCETQEEQVRQHSTQHMVLDREHNSLRSELERLQARLKEVEERHRLQLQALEHERAELQTLRDSLQEDVLKLRQKPDAADRYTQTDQPDTHIDPSTLVFDGVRKKVTAQQLHDCDVIDSKTLDHLVRGQQTVQDVAIDIKLNLKGTGAIAGLAAGPAGKLTITEAKRDNLITKESAVKLLEAQAATGYIIDPRANVKMTVKEACLSGLVDEEDKEHLLTAEAACIGFRDPNTDKPLSASQAMRKGLIDHDTALRLLQAQEAAGGVLDPLLSVYLPKDVAMDRDLIDESLYQALNTKPNCYIDPDTRLSASYISLKKLCKVDPNTGLLLLPAPQEQIMVQGLRGKVSVSDLVQANLLEYTDIDQLKEGKLTGQDIEHRLRAYLRGSTCIAGVFDEANKCILPIYQAMKEGLLRPGTTMELLEAQAASGFVIDPVNNQYYTVEEACKKHLVGVEFKDKLLSAERAVTGYKDPGTDKIISLFEAIERGLIEKGHGIRLLEAQIASGGIIDPKQSHRIDVDVAYQRGYFDKEMNQILKDEGDDTKGFFDPNNEDNLTYLQLKSRCITDEKTGLVLLPLHDKSKTAATQKNTTRKTRVVIVDPDTNKEMTVREAYDRKLIDYETYLELSQQESEWEEMTITATDGTSKLVITDKKTGLQYDLQELLDKSVIDQDTLSKYRSGAITLTQFVDIITSRIKPTNQPLGPSSSASSLSSQTTVKNETVSTIRSTPLQQPPSSPKRIASMSITLTSPGESIDEQNPVGAIFDTEKLEKISIYQAMKRGLVDSITGQRLLEAQACTGGIVNPENGRRISIQESNRLGIIDDDMANRLKPAQKAYIGFEDLKTKKKMSAAEAVKEKWLPYEAGQRFLEFQFLTGGLFDPEQGRRLTLEEALHLGWLDGRSAQKLLETRHHPKALTCPKTKLRISYKEAMDACMLEEKTGVRMLPAAATSSHGISSPYNTKPSSAPGSQSGSRRGSVDHSFSTSSSSRYSSFTYSRTSFSTRSLS